MPGAGTDKTKNWIEMPGPIIVLVEPQLGENIGAAARVMGNFGLSRLRLVKPRDGWPNMQARRAASGADCILEDAQLYETLDAAIADCTLVVATTRPTSLVVLDRDGVWWVEARDPAERDPETLRQTARSRWSVPYDELVELRVRVFWWGGGASLVARDRSGASRAVQIAPTEVEALQRKLDAVEHRLAHDTLVPEPPAAVGRFTAMALGFVVVFVEGLLSLGLITGLVAIIRPSRAALAAVAGVAGACLLVFAGDLGVRSPTWPTLAYAAAAGLVCAMAAWLARQPRTFDGRPADYLPTMGALVLVVALTWGPLVAPVSPMSATGCPRTTWSPIETSGSEVW